MPMTAADYRRESDKDFYGKDWVFWSDEERDAWRAEDKRRKEAKRIEQERIENERAEVRERRRGTGVSRHCESRGIRPDRGRCADAEIAPDYEDMCKDARVNLRLPKALVLEFKRKAPARHMPHQRLMRAVLQEAAKTL
jgi:hypothetical protein